MIAYGGAGFRAVLIAKLWTMRTGSGRMRNRENAVVATDVAVMWATEAPDRQEEARNIGFGPFAIHASACTARHPRTSKSAVFAASTGLTSNQPRRFTILCVAGSLCEPGPPCGEEVRHVSSLISLSNAEGS